MYFINFENSINHLFMLNILKKYGKIEILNVKTGTPVFTYLLSK